MTRTLPLTILLLIVCGVLPGPSQSAGQRSHGGLAIATVIDGVSSAPRKDLVVLIEGDRITRVAPVTDVKVPDGAQVEDVHIGKLHRLPAGREVLEIVGFDQRRGLVDVVPREAPARSERDRLESR